MAIATPFPHPATPPPSLRMTWEEFLDWTAAEEPFAEWVNGEVIFLTATAEHQIVTGFLVRVLTEYTQTHDRGLVLFAPFLIKLGPHLSGREPDVLFIAKENLHQLRGKGIEASGELLRGNRLEGPADLVVEVVSPDSVSRDRQDKFAEYQQAGMREYWIVDPETQAAEFYQRDAKGVFQRVLPDVDGVYHSAVIAGFWLDVAWLWQRPAPLLRDVFKAWGV